MYCRVVPSTRAAQHEQSVMSVSGTLDRPRVVAPSKTCGVCDPPGVVGVEPSVVIDLLHPRSAGSSSLALPLRSDVRFTACASVHTPQPGVVRSGLVSLPVVAARDQKWRVASDKSGLLSLLSMCVSTNQKVVLQTCTI